MSYLNIQSNNRFYSGHRLSTGRVSVADVDVSDRDNSARSARSIDLKKNVNNKTS